MKSRKLRGYALRTRGEKKAEVDAIQFLICTGFKTYGQLRWSMKIN